MNEIRTTPRPRPALEHLPKTKPHTSYPLLVLGFWLVLMALGLMTIGMVA